MDSAFVGRRRSCVFIARSHSLGGIAAGSVPSNAIRLRWAALSRRMKPTSFEASRGREQACRVRPRNGACRRINGLSREQIPVLTAQSRSAPAVFSAILRSRKFHDVDALRAPQLAPDVLLMTDGLSAYRKMSACHGMAYRAVPPPPQKKTQGLLPLNNINAYHRRLKGWMIRFRGVRSYLANYLGGHRRLDAARKISAKERVRNNFPV